jgi:hypothetical protein
MEMMLMLGFRVLKPPSSRPTRNKLIAPYCIKKVETVATLGLLFTPPRSEGRHVHSRYDRILHGTLWALKVMADAGMQWKTRR